VLGQSVSKNSFILAAFALVTAGILAGTHLLTAEKIAVEERNAAERALLEIIPLDSHNNKLLDDTLTLSTEQSQALGLDTPAVVHIAKLDGQAIAAIIPSVAPDGYSGDIKLIIGIYADGSIAGVRVLAHKETPGLGDKVDLKKSDWILSFDGKSLSNPEVNLWQVKKDGGAFDQFTGATITPRAVVNRVKSTLEFFQNNQALLFPTEETGKSHD